jgi:hypothetical protein
MAETSPPHSEQASRLEQQKIEAMSKMLGYAVGITENDLKITGAVASIVDTLAQEVAKRPRDFFSSGSGDADALVAALRARGEGGPGVSGGDIVGGLDWKDIVDTINGLAGFLKDEKAFVMDILRLIFCGCSGKGW